MNVPALHETAGPEDEAKMFVRVGIAAVLRRAVLALYLKCGFQKFQMGDLRFMKVGKTGL